MEAAMLAEAMRRSTEEAEGPPEAAAIDEMDAAQVPRREEIGRELARPFSAVAVSKSASIQPRNRLRDPTATDQSISKSLLKACACGAN